MLEERCRPDFLGFGHSTQPAVPAAAPPSTLHLDLGVPQDLDLDLAQAQLDQLKRQKKQEKSAARQLKRQMHHLAHSQEMISFRGKWMSRSNVSTIKCREKKRAKVVAAAAAAAAAADLSSLNTWA
jgi:hypothetical protein